MFYYTYVLQSLKDNSLYIGYTFKLKKRFDEYNSGKNRATKPFIPYKLIFYEAFLNRIDAKNREEYLKSGYGRRSIKKLLRQYLKSGYGRTFIKKHKLSISATLARQVNRERETRLIT
jgi:putative endonuclease